MTSGGPSAAWEMPDVILVFSHSSRHVPQARPWVGPVLAVQPLPVPRGSLIRTCLGISPIFFQPSPVVTGRAVSCVHLSVAEMALCCFSVFSVLFAFLYNTLSVTSKTQLGSAAAHLCTFQLLRARGRALCLSLTCLSSPQGYFFPSLVLVAPYPASSQDAAVPLLSS